MSLSNENIDEFAAISTLTPTQKIVSACVGALLTSLLVTPFDVVKTRLQSQPPRTTHQPFTSNFITSSCREVFFSCGDRFEKSLPWRNSNVAAKFIKDDAVLPKKPPHLQFNGTWDGVTKIVRYEGLTTLWKGLSPTLMMSIPATVIYFLGYDYLRDHLNRSLNQEWKPYAPLWAGVLSRSIAVTVIAPVELVRTRMQSVDARGKSFHDVLQSVIIMVRRHGIRTLWRGFSPTLLRDVPFSGIYWASYEYFNQKFTNIIYTSSTCSTVPVSHSPWSDFQISFLSGAISGMIAAAVTTPFDVIKTKLQVSPINAPLSYSFPSPSSTSPVLYSSSCSTPSSSTASPRNSFSRSTSALPKNGTVIQIFNNIVRREGYMGLLVGLSARIAKVAPACAIMISTYELGKLCFSQGNIARRSRDRKKHVAR